MTTDRHHVLPARRQDHVPLPARANRILPARGRCASPHVRHSVLPTRGSRAWPDRQHHTTPAWRHHLLPAP
ncbi:hypothetical protein, partial [Streptomyces sp. NPDC056188]|uniref:hypothetical protein n=1 Tax=Streptomyces sp. NPDC056188 TaxID=3345740 RepID=UPI0035D9062A